MKKFVLISLATGLIAGCAYAGGLDLLSRAELRDARAARIAASEGSRRMAPAAGVVPQTGVRSKIGAFIRLNEGYGVADLEKDGITVLSCRGDIALCMVPVDSAEVLAEKSPVRTMQIARKVHTHMDKGREAVGLDKMHDGLDGLDRTYTGKGVIAGVVDQGIDPNHVNFKNADGSTRIGYLYTINYANNQQGYADDGFWGEEVKNFTTDTPYGYHGTHTLGILAGDYQGDVAMPDASKFVDRNTAVPVTEMANPYRGAAPGVDIAAAACADLNDMFIAYGVDQLGSYSYDKRKPAVISMSLGSNVGPHDVNSLMNTYLDWTATKSAENPMPPIICLSAGNEGDFKICLKKTLTSEDDMLQSMIAPTYYVYDPDVEGSATARQDRIVIYSSDTTKLQVQAILYNKKRNYKVASRMPVIGDGVGAYYISDESFQVTTNDKVDANLGKYFYGSVGLGGMIDTDVNRYYAMIDYGVQNKETNLDETYILGFEVKIAPGQKIPEGGINVECYCSGETSEISNYGQASFDDGSRNGSISDMAMSPKMIVVGAYNTRNEWLCLDGYASRYESAIPDYFTVGKVTGFSSFGTLNDGRNLPTVCAPGSTIVSSVSRYYTELDDVKPSLMQYQAKTVDSEGRDNYWKQEPGTSMSTPLVAGAIACWLEADPDLTYADVQDIIKTTAIVDDDVRAGDPVQWGAGKFNAIGGLKEVIRRKESSGINSSSADLTNDRLIITSSGKNSYTLFVGGASVMDAEVVNMQGACVYAADASGDEMTISLDGLTRGVYVLSVNGHSRKIFVE